MDECNHNVRLMYGLLNTKNNMGNLTTITFRNDSYGCIKNNPKEVHQLILKAMNGEQLRKNRDTEPIGSSANPVIIQKYRHADDTTLYLHSGNTVTDVYKAKSKWAVDSFINEMEYHLKRLKKLKQEMK